MNNKKKDTVPSWQLLKFTDREKLIREEAWLKLVEEGKVSNHEKVSVAKSLQILCAAMAEADRGMRTNLRTPLHSSSKKYSQLAAYIRTKLKGFDMSFTESEQSMAMNEDEQLFNDPPAQQHS